MKTSEIKALIERIEARETTREDAEMVSRMVQGLHLAQQMTSTMWNTFKSADLLLQNDMAARASNDAVKKADA